MSARIVGVDMPPISVALKRGDRLPVPNPLHVGFCEGVVEDVVFKMGMTIVDLTIEVDGVYFAKVRGTKVDQDTTWSPLRIEAQS